MDNEQTSADKKKRTRKLKYGETTQAISARLPASDVNGLKELGDDCLSTGIVIAFNMAKKSGLAAVDNTYKELGIARRKAKA